MSESRFQGTLIRALSSQGLLVQKFNDLFAQGIPDLLAELPSKSPQLQGGPFPGMWLEAKFVGDLPKRATSPWPKKAHPSAEQMGWMGRWNIGQKPCAMIIRTPYGWACVPFQCIEAFFSRPHPETLPLFDQSLPGYGQITRNYVQCMSKLS